MKLLYQHHLTHAALDRVCETFDEYREAPEGSRSFALVLARGVERHLAEIDGAITAALEKWEFSRLAAIDTQIMRVAAFELLHCDDIPANVTIDEAIELSRQYSTGESAKFVNGVLGALASKHAAHKITRATRGGMLDS